MEGNENFGKNAIEKFLKENNIKVEGPKEELHANIRDMILKGGWAAYNSDDINNSIFISSELQKFIRDKKSTPTIEEQKFIDAVREAVRIRNKI
jgi:hypothetical protein